MARLLFGHGACGPAVEDIQRALALPSIDGVYGAATVAGVAGFQNKAGLAPTGETDLDTWAHLIRRPVPTLDERILALTAAFEGHGYALAQGNFDGAGITWGIIGFTLKSGSLGRVLNRIGELDGAVLPRVFGPLSIDLTEKLGQPPSQRVAWADTLSDGSQLVEPWKSAFRRMGEIPAARQAQREIARQLYFEPALATAKSLGIDDELGLALCFDIQVQNGGPRAGTVRQVRQAPALGARTRRELLARLTAATASERWRADVLERKLTIASGEGKVHGKNYKLANWGLGEYSLDQVLDQMEPRSG